MGTQRRGQRGVGPLAKPDYGGVSCCHLLERVKDSLGTRQRPVLARGESVSISRALRGGIAVAALLAVGLMPLVVAALLAVGPAVLKLPSPQAPGGAPAVVSPTVGVCCHPPFTPFRLMVGFRRLWPSSIA